MNAPRMSGIGYSPRRNATENEIESLRISLPSYASANAAVPGSRV
jgi:hypothetical protein